VRQLSDFLWCSRKIFFWITFVISGCAATLGADVITGQVRNQTRSQPAANDVVILLRAGHGLQEETRTRTDARGSFALTASHSENEYWLRVVHDGVNYDQQAAAGKSLVVDVFDAAAKVEGVTGSIEIIRAGTVGNLLHVSDMLEIKNGSTPPVTEVGERTFDVYLPVGAKLDSVLAAGPGNLAETISATAVPGDSGHYSVSFPLRPGATKFAFNYDLPYEGKVAFHTRHAYPLQEMAVMIPPSMQFSSRSDGFKILNTGNTKYRAGAFSPVEAGPGPEFEISGKGILPTIARPRNSEARPLPAVPENSAIPKALAPAPPSDSASGFSLSGDSVPVRASPSPGQFWPLGVLLLVVATACALAVKRVRAAGRVTEPTSITQARLSQPPLFLEELKEELFELETSRIRGTISAEQYATTRHALETVVKRAVRRAT
jgi:hypothetical protein